MTWWVILLIVLGALITLLLLFLYIVYLIAFYSPKKGQTDELKLEPLLNYQGKEEEVIKLVKETLDIPYEDLWIKSFDGLKLHAYFYENKNSNHFILMFNGYRGVSRRDFSGGANEVIKLGYNVLLCDERAHGKSGGHSITFGSKEQYDVLSWINFVKEKWGKSIKITIVGISMGGATVLLASDKIDPEIKVIADCPYSNQKDIMLNSLRKLKLPPKLFWPAVYVSSILFAHSRLKEDAINNVSRSKCKFLIIHGTSDTIVPQPMSERVYLSNKEKITYELFEGAEHGLSYLTNTKRYKEIIEKFLK